MNEQESSHAKQAWTYALIMVSVVALVIAVAGLLRPSPGPELTTLPTTSTTEPDPAAPVDVDIVEEPVDPTAPIPGCETVEPPGEDEYASSISIGEDSYNNPKFPWFNSAKATAMSNAAVESLPPDAEIEFASPERSLVFQPISDFGDAQPELKGYTYASAALVNGDAKGSVFLQVQKNSDSIPACVAGYLDERRTTAEGVVVDVQDTWREVDKVRTLTRSAHAYVSDQSWIHAAAYDNSGDGQFEQTGKIPLTIDDLVRIVTDPRLRVSTPAPPGTPPPPQGCRHSFGSDGDVNAPRIDRAQAQRLDSVLATIDLGGPRLNPLQPGGSPNSYLCSDNRDVKGAAGLYISITGGQPLPTPERPVPGSSGQQEMRTLPDGTVVQTQQSSGSVSATYSPDNSQRETTNSVEVTRPGGTHISVSSSAAVPNPPLSLEELESIALTDGLEL